MFLRLIEKWLKSEYWSVEMRMWMRGIAKWVLNYFKIFVMVILRCRWWHRIQCGFKWSKIAPKSVRSLNFQEIATTRVATIKSGKKS
jgi:hypothetical protein